MNEQNYARANRVPYSEQDDATIFMEEYVQRSEKPAGIIIPYIIATAIAVISAIVCLAVGVVNPDARMTWAIILFVLSALALGASIAGHVMNAKREHPRNWVIASTLSVVFAVSMALMLLLFGAGRAIGDFATGTTETVSGVAQGIGETAQDIGNAAAAVGETADGFRQDVSETAKTVENVAHGVNDAREGVKSAAQGLSGVVPDSDDPADAERVLNELPKSAEEVQEDAAQVREGVKTGVEGLIMGLFGKN